MSLTIRKKIFLVTGIVFILVIIVSLVGIWSIWRVGTGVTIIEDHCSKNSCWNSDVIKKLKISFEKIPIPVHKYVISGNRNHSNEFERLLGILKEEMDEALKMVKSSEGSQMTNLEMPLSMARKSIPDIELWAGQVFAESDPLNQNISKVLQNLDTTSRKVISQLDFLLNFYTDDTRATLVRANNLRLNFSIIMILVFFLLALAILGSGFLLARGITNPIKKLVQATQRVAAGELTYKVPVSSSDEIGELAKCFNAMTEDLQKYQNKLVANERLATLGTFVSYVSHELRNPLHILTNCVFFLETKTKTNPDEPVFRKYLKMMQGEIDAAKKIVEDCLTFSKDKKLDLKMVNLNDLLEKILTLTEIPEHIHIRKEFYADLPSIMVDESQIQQVAINIATNAIMAMSDQGELMIITRSGEDYHEVEFTDTGPGIPEQNFTKLFDPFFTTKTHGTGLGLAICKFIIESHGGLIWAENAQGRGASFFIRLPFEPAQKLLIRQQHENSLVHANC